MQADKKVRVLNKKNMTHKKIMHSAKALFEKKGIDKVTIEDICDRTEICRSTFFNHFPTIDDLINGIANEEIEDLIRASEKFSGIDAILELINKLIEDTIPYPTLTTQFMVSYIIKNQDENNFKKIEKIIRNEIQKINKNQTYTIDQKVSTIVGGYYGLVFSKLINKESFGDGNELKDSMKKLITNII